MSNGHPIAAVRCYLPEYRLEQRSVSHGDRYWHAMAGWNSERPRAIDAGLRWPWATDCDLELAGAGLRPDRYDPRPFRQSDELALDKQARRHVAANTDPRLVFVALEEQVASWARGEPVPFGDCPATCLGVTKSKGGVVDRCWMCEGHEGNHRGDHFEWGGDQ